MDKSCLTNYYTECQEYHKSKGIEVDEMTKIGIAARLLLAIYTNANLMVLHIPCLVNGVEYDFEYIIAIEEKSIMDLLCVFSYAKSKMELDHHGKCEILIDKFVNDLINTINDAEFNRIIKH